MKKILMVAVITGIIIPGSLSFAQQSGGLSYTVDAQQLDLSTAISFEKRPVRGDKDEINDDVFSRQFIVKVDYGLLDWWELSIRAGLADLSLDEKHFNGSLQFLYGGGTTFRLYQNEELAFKICFDANIEVLSTHESGVKVDALESQGAFLLSRKYDNFIPYGGIQGSYLDLDADTFKAQSSSHVGLLVGADYFINPYVRFHMEIHIFDQESINAGVGYSF